MMLPVNSGQDLNNRGRSPYLVAQGRVELPALGYEPRMLPLHHRASNFKSSTSRIGTELSNITTRWTYRYYSVVRSNIGAGNGIRTRTVSLEGCHASHWTPYPRFNSIYNGGSGWIRTISPVKEQIYSLPRLSNFAALPLTCRFYMLLICYYRLVTQLNRPFPYRSLHRHAGRPKPVTWCE